ncbi:MAG: phenylalanine--tRNA ligase subunit alpha, partial [Anaerolineae bacterium]|nr:phenylalanine--tRNA ligase subunit alpha [Anaerolineae bacterium]
MLEKLKEIERTALAALESATDDDSLESWRVAYLGRSSPVMKVFSGFGKLSKEQRPAVGQAANKVKVALEAAFSEKTEAV